MDVVFNAELNVELQCGRIVLEGRPESERT